MIQTEVSGDVTTVTISRPSRRNALTRAGLDDLAAAIKAAETPVVYLTGAAGAFSAGADFDVVASLDHDDARTFARQGQRTARTIETAENVVVAGIDGPARGGGVELALACDTRVATPEATFAETGVTLGLFGAWGGTVRLPRVLGEGDAMDLALSGRVVDAEEAHRMGLVSRVVEDPRAVAEEVAANEPDALAAVKRRMRDGTDRVVQEAREAEVFADLVVEHADELDR
ncbi:enoyl-CoA hydratase/isomerase family protein [Haloarchaeobius sp. TZWSO28]|uniref:enoyl-CoA hydratase/isomerase family protein n=1 Tax=Haloarchaeobius sp. TZWSO28 TaxID=3446119 RepID=UPI003EC06D6F